MALTDKDLEKINQLMIKRSSEATTALEIRLETRLESRLSAVIEKTTTEMRAALDSQTREVIQDEISGTETRLSRLIGQKILESEGTLVKHIGEARLETQLLRSEMTEKFEKQDQKTAQRFNSLREDIDLALRDTSFLKRRTAIKH